MGSLKSWLSPDTAASYIFCVALFFPLRSNHSTLSLTRLPLISHLHLMYEGVSRSRLCSPRHSYVPTPVSTWRSTTLLSRNQRDGLRVLQGSI
ncbi:hypothetical protein K439DRAFT_710904 [Ramaria rubella]|nr:hypothetical protein K439DRAFT_710904 [Ramaria rubella]